MLTASDDSTSGVPASGAQFALSPVTRPAYYGRSYSPDGKWVLSSSDDSTARLWDAATGQHCACFSGHTKLMTAPPSRPTARPSSPAVATIWPACESRAAPLSPEWGRLLVTLSGHTDGVTDATFSPDGKYVLTGSIRPGPPGYGTRRRGSSCGSTPAIPTALTMSLTRPTASISPVVVAIIRPSSRDARTGEQIYALTGNQNCV